MTEINKIVGEQIKRIRKEEGLTQEQLGEKINKNKGNISSIETGRFNNSLNELEKVANALGRKIKITFEKF